MHPFSDQRAETIAQLGEGALLGRIREWLGSAAPEPPYGMGDDTAVLPLGTVPGSARQLITVDGLVLGRHFDASATPEQAGAKLMKRNLSDIAAMGGTPGSAVCALQCGANLRLDWLERFTRGMAAECARYGVALCGGDLSEGAPGSFSGFVTLMGWADKPVLRTAARVGDRVCVTGRLGGSIRGWHLDFVPRLAEGRWLAALPEIGAMIDLTDGIAKDLPALLPPKTVALLNPEAIPLSEAAHAVAAESDQPPLAHALSDGEDYELLFTLRAESDFAAIQTAFRERFDCDLTQIGHLAPASVEAPGTLLDATTRQPLPGTHGFEHFTA